MMASVVYMAALEPAHGEFPYDQAQGPVWSALGRLWSARGRLPNDPSRLGDRFPCAE